jgi:hypothetical protein
MDEITNFYKIVSDGQTHKTMIYDPSGQPMPLVQEVVIHIQCQKPFVEIVSLKAEDIAIRPTIAVAEIDIEVPEEDVTVVDVPIPGKKESPE